MFADASAVVLPPLRGQSAAVLARAHDLQQGAATGAHTGRRQRRSESERYGRKGHLSISEKKKGGLE